MPVMASQILKYGFHKHKNLDENQERTTIFSSNKNNHWLQIKDFVIANNSFVVEITFNV